MPAGLRPFVTISTGDRDLDQVQRNVAAFAAQLEEIRRGLFAFSPVVKASSYTIGEESFLVYTGGVGGVFTLPKADALDGKARFVFIMNEGSASVLVRASGSDVLYVSTGTSTTPPTITSVAQNQAGVFVSDGSTGWKSAGRSDPLTLANLQLRVAETFTNRSIASGINGAKQLFSWTTGDGSAGSTGYPIFAFNGLMEPKAYDASHPTVMLFANGAVLQFGTSGDTLLTAMAGGGLQIGSTATEKIGEYGGTPVAQCAHITHATDLPTAIAAINDLLTFFEARGTVAP